MEAKDSIVVVADSPTCTGFRLAGVQKAFFGLGKEAETKINELIALPDVGIIVVNENIIDSCAAGILFYVVKLLLYS